jgi:hypothetical protein
MVNDILHPFFIFPKHFYTFTVELEISKKQSEQDRKAIDDLVRERDILNKVNIYFLIFDLLHSMSFSIMFSLRHVH